MRERDRQKDVEILTSKAKLIDLEKQLKNVETERKKDKIEFDAGIMEKQMKITKIGEEKEELKKQLKYLLEKEETAREEAKNLQKKLSKLQDQYKNDIDDLKKVNKNFMKDMDEVYIE